MSNEMRNLLGVGAAVAGIVACADESNRQVSQTSGTGNNNDRALTSSAVGAIPAARGTMFKTLSSAAARLWVRDDVLATTQPGAPRLPPPVATMADGKKFPVWGLVELSSGFGFNGTLITPGPVLEMTQGQKANISLTSVMSHSIHWHGMDVPTAVDGDPETSGWVGNLPSPRNPSTSKRLGTPFTYSFVAPSAGTYFYHCHVDTVVHMEMGMMGAIVVRPPDGSKDLLYTYGPVYDAEFLWQLHTMDSMWHVTGHIESGHAHFDYNPDYFLINGMDGAALTTNRSTAIACALGQTILVRLVNFGYLAAEVWLGGVEFSVVMSDGRQIPKNYTTQTLFIGAGERYDILIFSNDAIAVSPEIRYFDASGTNILGIAVTSLTIS